MLKHSLAKIQSILPFEDCRQTFKIIIGVSNYVARECVHSFILFYCYAPIFTVHQYFKPTLFRWLNCAQGFDYRALGSSRKLGGAAEHLIDGSEKRICRLSSEF